MEHGFSGRCCAQFPETTVRYPPSGNSRSIYYDPSLIPVSGFRDRFSVDETDLYKWQALLHSKEFPRRL